jgi:hypothetical protein
MTVLSTATTHHLLSPNQAKVMPQNIPTIYEGNALHEDYPLLDRPPHMLEIESIATVPTTHSQNAE